MKMTQTMNKKNVIAILFELMPLLEVVAIDKDKGVSQNSQKQP